jgi:sulfite exporter TauE/SafE
MTRVLAEGLLLGLATGPQCLVSCATLLVPYFLAEGRRGWRGQAVLVGQFMAGRLAAYLIVGAAAGGMGRSLLDGVPGAAWGAVWMLMGVLLVAHGLGRRLPELSLCARAARWTGAGRFPLFMGFAAGLNLCPPFMAGLTRAAALGNVLSGAAFFAAFFIGTGLYVMALMAASPWAGRERLQRVGALSCVLAGLWWIGRGLVTLIQ